MMPRFISPNAIPLETSFAQVYVEPQNLCAKGYIGKQSKTAFNYRFRNINQLWESVTTFFEGQMERQKEKARRMDERVRFVHDLKVGDVLHYSWGYDQTNCEFYVVTGVKGKMVQITECASKTVSTEGLSSMAAMVVPVESKMVSPDQAMWKLPNRFGVPMKFGNASKWHGKPCYSSWYA
jgi:hypothetical protein